MSIRRICNLEFPLGHPIPYSKFSLVPNNTVTKLLKDAIFQVDNERAQTTLLRLQDISPAAARHLQPKSKAIDNLRFRVLGSKADPAELRSYVTLSYRWHGPSAGTLGPDYSDKHVELPVSATLLQASLNELQSESEGLWFDRGCIHQDDATEVDNAIGAMDLIYQSARVVVVVLDDVKLNMGHCRTLIKFLRDSKSQPRLCQDAAIRVTIQSMLAKLMNSSYFSRAWCRHEFLLAKKRIFLLHILDPTGTLDRPILRLTDQDLHRMLEVLSSPVVFGGQSSDEVGQRLSELRAYYNTRYLSTNKKLDSRKLATFAQQILAIASIDPLKADGSPRISTQLRKYDGNADKMAIMLNSANTGLVLDRSSFSRQDYFSMTEDACIQKMLLLSLAQGNPLPLCARGAPLHTPDSNNTWLARLHRKDIQEIGRLAEDLPGLLSKRWPMHVDLSAACSFVDLDFIILEPVRSKSSATIESLILAEQIIGIANKLASDAQTGLGTREILARFLDAGRDWIPVLRADSNGVSTRTNPTKTEQTLIRAFDNLLTPDWRSLRTLTDLRTDSHELEMDAIFIWEYIVTILKQNIIPFRPMRGSSKDFKMIWLQGANNQRVIAFTPLGLENATFAVPAAISHPEYESLARCWVLEKHNSVTAPSEQHENGWAIRSKIKFGELLRFGNLDAEEWNIQRMRVTGHTVD